MGDTGIESKQRRGRLTKPTVLKAGHDVGSFDCGHPELTNWLKSRAHQAAESDTARTFVVCRGNKTVVAYMSLAAGGVEHKEAPGALKRNTPDPIPVFILARLAVDRNEQGRGIGRALLSDAMRRVILAGKHIAARALLVHALDGEVATYYESFGFRRFMPGANTLYLPMKTIREGL